MFIELKACPRDDAPAGWQGWQLAFDVLKGATTGSEIVFGVSVDPDGSAMRVSTPRLHERFALPKDHAALFQQYPELIGLLAVLGALPPAADGHT